MLLYELRYAAMRLLRLGVTLTSEVACLAFAVAFVVTGIRAVCSVFNVLGDGDPWTKIPIAFGLFAASTAAMVVCWSVSFASSVPFKYKTKVPGLELVTCGHCEHRIPNTYVCPECGKFRWETACFSVAWGLSASVTVAWLIHDVTFAAILLWPGKRS